MVGIERLASRRAIVLSTLTGATALAGANRSRVAPAGPGQDAGGTPAVATPISTPVADVPEIVIEAKGLRFSPSTVSIPAHTPVRIVFTDRSRVYHDLVIPGLGRRTPRIGPNESNDLLIRAEPGSYYFHCSIQSHHQAGMEGTITAT